VFRIIIGYVFDLEKGLKLGHALCSSRTREDARDHVSLRASTSRLLGVLRVRVWLNPRAAKLFFAIARLVSHS